ncbi:MAG: hypothetical protein QG641_1845, partial [Candidatus Poribacteria bacterium]|nr:hypothetical protein [Candidatus Poribacteria bacterium]
GYLSVVKYYVTELAETYKNRGEIGLQASTMLNLGILCYNRGKWEDAIEAYKTTSLLAHSIQDKRLESSVLNAIGAIHRELGNNDEAISYFEKSLDLSDHLNDKRIKAGLINNLGLMYMSLGKNDIALQYFCDAIKIFNQNNDLQGEAMVSSNIGDVYISTRDYKSAIKYYEESIKYFAKLGNKSEQASLINNVGTLFEQIEEIDKALQYYKDALALEHEIGNFLEQSRTLRNIAVVQTTKKNWTESANACIESFQIAVQLHANTVIDSLKNILNVIKIILKSGELAAPIQLGIELMYFIKKVEIQDDDMRAAVAISEGIFTIIGFITACGWDKTSDVYKEALELAKSLDENTGSALKLVEWLD